MQSVLCCIYYNTLNRYPYPKDNTKQETENTIWYKNSNIHSIVFLNHRLQYKNTWHNSNQYKISTYISFDHSNCKFESLFQKQLIHTYSPSDKIFAISSLSTSSILISLICPLCNKRHLSQTFCKHSISWLEIM